MELENLVLKNPTSIAFRMHQLGLAATLGTSGGNGHPSTSISLLPSVPLLRESDITNVPKKLVLVDLERAIFDSSLTFKYA